MNEPYLDVTAPTGNKRVALSGGPLTIGRNFTNLLVLEEPMASRFHCVIEKASEGFRIRDLGSKNGTKVNGTLIKASRLLDGDVVAIGQTQMKLMMPAVTVAAAHETADGVDELEVVEDSEESSDEPDPFAPPEVEVEVESEAVEVSEDDWEQTLRSRADSLPDKAFLDTDIALVNARGKTAHAPKVAGGKADPGSDALTLLRLIMLVCFRSRATDIHVEPKNDDVHVRVRVDGNMVDVVRINKDLGVKLLSLVKVLSDIDISQKNSVQEGHYSARVPSGSKSAGGGPRRVDYRISFAPAMFGQKLVVRVLDTANAPLHIGDLKMQPRVVETLRRSVEKDSGMILVCGPTGSGKTTTLYAVLRDIDTNERNVVTIEDPVEIQLEGVTQIPVNEAQGNTFAVLLRSVLRQDPDAILVGEIRDADTARVAVQAAMTGHLVFSTVHSRDTVGTVYRLIDLGVEPYMVSSGLDIVLAQRLVRQLCPFCKVAIKPIQQQVDRMAKYGVGPVKQMFKPKGCQRCLNTGFAGRRGVIELLMATTELRDVILRSPTVQDIQQHLNRDNYVPLQESGYQLVADGISSFEEVERAVT